MSLLKKISLALSILSLAFSTKAEACLYGFSVANPETIEEQLLDMPLPPRAIVNYRKEMRDIIASLVSYAKKHNPDFIFLTHEGTDILYKSLWEYHLDGYNEARTHRINANDPSFLLTLEQRAEEIATLMKNDKTPFAPGIDGIVLNNVICEQRDIPEKIKDSNKKIISIDKCENGEFYDRGIKYALENNMLFYGFINSDTSFKKIRNQPLINENARNIFTLSDASNISFFLDDSLYNNKQDFIEDVASSNFDIVIINPTFQNKSPFSADEVNRLRLKKNGTKRLLIAAQNLSEAKNSDYFWRNNWQIENPSFIRRESFVCKDGYIMEYWQKPWREIISEYFKSIIRTGYDGVFFTGLENHTYFEKLTPLE